MAEIVLALRVALSLGVVLLCLWGVAKWYERRGSRVLGAPGPARRAPLNVVARAPLSRHTSVALLDVGGRTLVVGVGEQQLTLLADLPSDAAALDAPDSLGDGVESADGPGRREPFDARDAVAQILPMLRRTRAQLPGTETTASPALTATASPAHTPALTATASPAHSPALPAADSLGSPLVALRPSADAADSLGASPATRTLSRRERAERERAMRLHPAGKALQVAAGTLPPLDAPEAEETDGFAAHLAARDEVAPTVADLGAVQSLAAARRPRPNGPLAGSVLDPHSWSQAASVLRSLRKAQ